MKLPIKISLIASCISIVFMLLLFDNVQNQLIKSKNDIAIKNYKKDLENLKHTLDLILSKAKNTLTVISIAKLNDSNVLNRFQNRFEYYMTNIDEISSMKYISLNGKELIHVSNKRLFNKVDTKSYLDENIFKVALTNDFFIGDVYFSQNNEMMIKLSKSVLDVNSNKIVGVMIIEVSMSSIQDLMSDKLVDFDAVILMNKNTNSAIYKSSMAQNISNEIFLTQNDEISNIVINKNKYLVASIDYINGHLNMKFSLLIKESNLFIDINKTLNKNLQFLLIIIIISSFIMFFILRYMLKPLNILIYDIKKLSNDISSSFSSKQEFSDEIGEIKYYFYHFVELVKEDKKRISDFNKLLKIKIKDEVKKNQLSQELLMQQSKMASMGEMLESIAHQWRQPLSIITTSSTGMKLEKEYDLLTDKQFYLSCDSITNSANHLSQTIDDFRSFFKQEKTKKAFNLKDVYQHTLNLLISKFKNKDIEIIENIEELSVIGFGNELVQVYMNILNNSRDELEIKDQKRLIFIDIYQENEYAVIKIKDNAGGVPDDIINDIFEPHFTTKGERDGTGIGLYMSKKIIEKSFKGTIVIGNEEFYHDEIKYKGALTTIMFPINLV